MIIQEILKRLSKEQIILLSLRELPDILSQGKIVEETDTLISDYI